VGVSKDLQLARQSIDTTIDRVKTALQAQVDSTKRSLREVVAGNLAALANQVQQLQTSIAQKGGAQGRIGDALSGNMSLILDSEDEEVSAAALNAAVAGTFKKQFVCALSAIYGEGEGQYNRTHEWASFEPVLTGGNTGCWNPSAIKWTDNEDLDPAFAAGELRLTVTFLTDEGSAKIYEEDDTVTVDVQVAVDDKWLTLPVTKVTKTYNVVA
jgi:hypothetical protein